MRVAEGLDARLGGHALRVRVQRRVLLLEHRPRVRAVDGRNVPEVEHREVRPRELQALTTSILLQTTLIEYSTYGVSKKV